MLCEAISNTRKSVSLDIQTLGSWLKNSAVPRFFNPLLSVWISDEILFLVFDITCKALDYLSPIGTPINFRPRSFATNDLEISCYAFAHLAKQRVPRDVKHRRLRSGQW